MHAAGEPLRVIVDGLPPIPGARMLEKRRYAQEHLDAVRRRLMWEPRGHADMYGAIVTEPVREGSDCGVLFLHNEGFSTMCGHGIIAPHHRPRGDRAWFAAGEEHPSIIRIDTPAGLVVARARRDGESRAPRELRERARRSCTGAASRCALDGHGVTVCDIAFGGAYYAFCEAADLGLHARTLPA